MEALYAIEEDSITLVILPSEAESVLVRMQLLLEETQRKGNDVPVFPDNFFEKFSVSKKKIPLVFSSFTNVDFAISFIEEFIRATDSNIENVENLKHFLYKYKVEFSISHTIH